MHLATRSAVAVLILLFSFALSVQPLSGEHKPKPPDRGLFERAQAAVQRNKFEVANLSLQTLINSYPESEYAGKAKRLMKEPRIAKCGTNGFPDWSQTQPSDCR